MYIGSTADGVIILLTILMSHRELYSRVNMYHLTALLMRGHWWCVGYMYIGSTVDGGEYSVNYFNN